MVGHHRSSIRLGEIRRWYEPVAHGLMTTVMSLPNGA